MTLSGWFTSYFHLGSIIMGHIPFLGSVRFSYGIYISAIWSLWLEGRHVLWAYVFRLTTAYPKLSTRAWIYTLYLLIHFYFICAALALLRADKIGVVIPTAYDSGTGRGNLHNVGFSRNGGQLARSCPLTLTATPSTTMSETLEAEKPRSPSRPADDYITPPRLTPSPDATDSPGTVVLDLSNEANRFPDLSTNSHQCRIQTL